MSDISDDKARKYPPPFSIRFTFEESAQLDKLSAGVPLGKFIKDCLFKLAMCPDAPARLPIQDKKLIAKLLGLFGKSRIASNLNQLVKAANSGSLPINDEVQKAILEAAHAVLWMRDTLIQALGLNQSDQIRIKAMILKGSQRDHRKLNSLSKSLYSQHGWAISDNKQSFETSMKERGYYIAKGDKRGHVALMSLEMFIPYLGN